MSVNPAPNLDGGSRPAAPEEPAAGPSEARRRWADEDWNRRRRLERQLHDGPALRIAALTLHLGLLSQKLHNDPADLRREIEDLQGQLHAVLQELRVIADQIYPPLLQEAGLGPALGELVGRAQVPVHVHATNVRFDAAVEGIAYFTVLEVLESLPPDAPAVDVTVRRDGAGLVLDLANVDTGQGSGVGDRIEWAGGAVEVLAGQTAGTIRVRIPCE